MLKSFYLNSERYLRVSGYCEWGSHTVHSACHGRGTCLIPTSLAEVTGDNNADIFSFTATVIIKVLSSLHAIRQDIWFAENG